MTFAYQVTAGGLTSNTATVTLNVVAAPTLANPGGQSNTAGDAVSLQLQGNGPNPLLYSAAGLPTGTAIDPSSGLIYGNVDPAASASSTVTATVTDTVTGATASQTFAWAVAPAPYQAPTLDPIPDQTNSVGDFVYIPVSVEANSRHVKCKS